MVQPQQISLDEFLCYGSSFDRFDWWLSGHNLEKQASRASALVNSKLECDVINHWSKAKEMFTSIMSDWMYYAFD